MFIGLWDFQPRDRFGIVFGASFLVVVISWATGLAKNAKRRICSEGSSEISYHGFLSKNTVSIFVEPPVLQKSCVFDGVLDELGKPHIDRRHCGCSATDLGREVVDGNSSLQLQCIRH